MSGWFAMTRESLRHDLFERGPVTEWEAWARLIARAAYESTTHYVGGEMATVPRGSFFCTLRDLQSEFMWRSDKRVRTFLQKLENGRMIGRKTNAKRTLITICNYDEYQMGGRKLDAKQTHSERTKEQENNLREKEKASPSPKKGTRLPADWFLPKEWGEWAVSEGMTPERVRLEAEKFRDHWHSTTRNATKMDWLAAWRNWCRKAMERGPQQRSNGRGQDRFDRRMQFARDLEERRKAERDVAGGTGDGALVPLLPARNFG